MILLLDERFCQQENLQLFPWEWSDYRKSSLLHIEAQLQEFWRKRLTDNT